MQLDGMYLFLHGKIWRIQSSEVTTFSVRIHIQEIEADGQGGYTETGKRDVHSLALDVPGRIPEYTPVSFEEARERYLAHMAFNLQKSEKAVKTLKEKIRLWGGSVDGADEKARALEAERKERLQDLQQGLESFELGEDHLKAAIRKVRRFLTEGGKNAIQ